MNKPKKSKKKVYFLLSLFTIFAFSSFIAYGYAVSGEFTFDIDLFKDNIQSTSDDCWKKPAENRKNTICNKLTGVQLLIDEENFEDAYDKLLHDIKPKLTGLKKDEHGIAWGNGVHVQPWVICPDLQQSLCVECDHILSQINPLSVYDDDKTPPTITITYDGGNYLANIGSWHVTIEDLESGIDEVLIEIDGIVYIHELNLGGPLTLEYNDIAVPFAIGMHMIVVSAVNNDKDYEWDQETGTEADWVEIVEDTTAPVINIVYQGDNTDENPGIWNVNVYDDESGINEASLQILVDGEFAGNYLGDYGVPNSLMDHLIYVEVENNDPVSPLLNSASSLTTIIDDDDTPPVITYTYTGDGTDGNPGEIVVSASDNVGLSEDPSGTYTVPNTLGAHEFSFTATDNDNDRTSDCLTTTLSISIEIVDDDTKHPIISVIYSGSGFDGDPGGFSWTITDIDDGIGGDNDMGLSQIIILGSYESSVGLPNHQYLFPPLEIGNWDLTLGPGLYILEITAFDNDDDRTLAVDALSAGLNYAQTIIDDDTSAPTISIQYIGDGNILNPGLWHVEVEDPESGLDSVEFLINDVQCEYDQAIGGLNFKQYDISVPDVGGEYTLTVIAKNNDNDWSGDQEQSTDTNYQLILSDVIPPSLDQPNDISYEYLSIGHEISWTATDEHPATYTITLDGVLYESGTWVSAVPISINVDGLSIGTHEILISVLDLYDNSATDSVYVNVLEDDDNTPPIVDITSEIYDEFNPGFLTVYIIDFDSGLASVQILINGLEYLYDQNLNGIESIVYTVPLPFIQGEVLSTVIAQDNDNESEGDSLSTTAQHLDVIPDGDTEAPTGYTSYDGSYLDSNSGTWHYYVEDLESGLADVLIFVDGVQVLHDENLNGVISMSYNIPVPATPGVHWMECRTTDYDIDIEGDQLTAIDTADIFIEDDDISEPIITIQYYGSGTTYDSGYWNVIVEDLESGLDEVQILINGVEELYDQGLNGILSKSYDVIVPNSVGVYTILVIAKNNDNDWNGDQQQIDGADTVEIVFDDDGTPPVITIERGFNLWNVFIDDLESGVDEVIIEINGVVLVHDENLNGIISLSYYHMFIQGGPGTYTITITAKNNDKDYVGDQEINTVTDSQPKIQMVETDDDFTPPTILITYEGEYTETNPGTWHIDAEDLQSGLDEVRISINGVEQIYDQNLEGIISIHYDIPVPNIGGIYTLEVTAINNDKDFEGDQESYTKYQIVDINPDPAPPSDDDITGPSILLEYVLGGYYEGVWRIYIEDLESGLDRIQIILDGTEFLYDFNLNGITSKFYQIDAYSYTGVHSIEIIAVNHDHDYPGDEELSIAFDSICVDNTGPTIEIFYDGGHSELNPGVWIILIEDPESGIDKVQVIVDGGEAVMYIYDGELSVYFNVDVPGIEGLHTIEVIAFNNDKDYVGDQESETQSDEVQIIYVPPMPPPPPPPDDDTTPPTIEIYYEGGSSTAIPGIWILVIEDLESGIDEVHITVDGGDSTIHSFNGQLSIYLEVNVPGTEGFHTIEVIAFNNDKDWEGDQESETQSDVVQIVYMPPMPLPSEEPADETAPIISISYAEEFPTDDSNPPLFIG
ncbi:MAG: hypothetical protein ACFE9S_08910 [Candidatus Hermodarchaeota archaeon]